MAFNPNNLIKLQPSSLLTQPAAIPSVVPPKAVTSIWTYQAGSDTKANVEAAGYFVYFANFDNTLIYEDGQFLQVGDLIYCSCTDGGVQLVVTSVSGTITTTTYAPPPSGTTSPAHGGTGLVNPSAHGIMVAEGALPMTSIVLTNGEILVGSTGADPVPATITEGTGITVTNGPGSITISATGGAGANWPYGAGFLEGEGGLFTLPGTFGATTSTTQATPQDATNLFTNMLLIPIMCVNGFTISDWIINVSVALAGSSVNLSIYDSDSSFAFPASSSAALGGVNITTASTGFRFGSLSLALSANTLYWLGVQFSTATTLSVTAAALNIMNQGAGISITPAAGTNLWFQPNSFVAGTYPNSFSTYTTGIEMVNFPLIIFE
jgi:hypothetical protein